jgi:hypothetical protein
MFFGTRWNGTFFPDVAVNKNIVTPTIVHIANTKISMHTSTCLIHKKCLAFCMISNDITWILYVEIPWKYIWRMRNC